MMRVVGDGRWGRWRGGWDERCGDFCLRSKCKNRDSAERKGGRCGVWQMQTKTWIYEGLARVRRGGCGERIFAAEIIYSIFLTTVAKIVTAHRQRENRCIN